MRVAGSGVSGEADSASCRHSQSASCIRPVPEGTPLSSRCPDSMEMLVGIVVSPSRLSAGLGAPLGEGRPDGSLKGLVWFFPLFRHSPKRHSHITGSVIHM